MASSHTGGGASSSNRGPRGGSSSGGNGRGRGGGGVSNRNERGERPDRDLPSFDHHRRAGGRPRTEQSNGDNNYDDNRNREHRRGGGGDKEQRQPNPIGIGPSSKGAPILRGVKKQPQQGQGNGHQHPQQLPPRLANHRNSGSEKGQTDNSDYNDKNCIVCYKEVKYYSVGACNHSVCYECSGRMRVLMEQNECPICRQTLEFVIMSKGLKSFRELQEKLRMFIWLPQWGVYLEGEEIQWDFEALLEHRCQFCPELFPNFKELKSHTHRVHEMYACDLCAENIKLFSKERRFYTRQELATHKRKGDRNDKSHRGHPICEFCDRRYFDSDELYKHLRKDHYFCHFCDADGLNHYYNTYDDLRIHFRKEHFLCEEEDCKDEKFTSVFRSDIDRKAHLTLVHSRLLGKHGTKAARMIDVEFNMKSDEERRSRRFNGDGGRVAGGGRGGYGGRRERDYHDNHHHNEGHERERDEGNNGQPQPPPSFEPTIHAQPKVDSVADFPLLEGASKAPILLPVTNGGSHANSSIAQKIALASGKNVINNNSTTNQQPPLSSSQSSTNNNGAQNHQRPRWNAKVTGSSRHDEEFPALGPDEDWQLQGAAGSTRPFSSTLLLPPSTSNVKKPPSESKRNGFARPVSLSSAMEEFPSLGSSSMNGGGGAWIGSGVKKKQMPKSLKVAKPPLERKIEVDPFDEFQFVPLSVSRARKDSLSEKYECILEPESSDIGPPPGFGGLQGKVAAKNKKRNKN